MKTTREEALNQSVADAINAYGLPSWMFPLICEAMVIIYDDDRAPERITDFNEMSEMIDAFETGYSNIESLQIQRNFTPLKTLVVGVTDTLLSKLPD